MRISERAICWWVMMRRSITHQLLQVGHLFPSHQLILPISHTLLLVNNYFVSALQADEVATAIRQPPKADKATDDRTGFIGEMLP
jgi:hypothetical protein